MNTRSGTDTKHRDQLGFTLVEMLVALVITGVIGAAVTNVVTGIISNNTRNTAHMLAVKQVENASHWISTDARMAQNIVLDTGTDSHFPVTITWTDWNSIEYTVIYTLNVTDLERQYFEDGELISTNVVARYVDIDPTKTTCEYENGVFNLTLTAVVNNIQGSSETRVIEIRPRTL